MTLDGPISTHFTWAEVMFTTHRSLIEAQRTTLAADPVAQANARELAALVLEPIRQRFGPIVVHSWYRCAALNSAVGGVRNSQHLEAAAADIHAVGATLDELWKWIAASSLPYSQNIREPIGSPTAGWVHVGLHTPGRPQGQVIR